MEKKLGKWMLWWQRDGITYSSDVILHDDKLLLKHPVGLSAYLECDFNIELLFSNIEVLGLDIDHPQKQMIFENYIKKMFGRAPNSNEIKQLVRSHNIKTIKIVLKAWFNNAFELFSLSLPNSWAKPKIVAHPEQALASFIEMENAYRPLANKLKN